MFSSMRARTLIAGLIGSLILSACGGQSSAVLPVQGAAGAGQGPVTQAGASQPIRMGTVFKRTVQPDTVSDLLYHNGRLLMSSHIYVVYWGNWSSSGDPQGEAAYLNAMLNGAGSTSWLSPVTQYYSGASHIQNPAGILKGTWNDTSTPPSLLSDSEIAQEAAKAWQHFLGVVDPNAMIFVATPTGVSESGFGTQWCAWHNATTAGGSSLAYTFLPYMTDAGTNCGKNYLGHPLDGVSIVAGHELAEAITDPAPSSGWVDGGGAEIGDKCAWTNIQMRALTNGSYAMQPLWSNAAGGCAYSYSFSPSLAVSPTSITAYKYGASVAVTSTCKDGVWGVPCYGLSGSSSNAMVARYSGGYVTPYQIGTATITINWAGRSGKIGVNVIQDPCWKC